LCVNYSVCFEGEGWSMITACYSF